MPILCAATGCKSKMGLLSENGRKISFHRFPKDDDLKNKWVKNMGRREWTPSIFSRLCSKHFQSSCYRGGFERRILHSYAIPTIFSNRTANMEKNPRKPIFRLKRSNEASSSTSHDEEVEPRKKKNRFGNQDCMTSTDNGLADIEQLKKQLKHYKTLAAKRGLRLKTLQRKHSRALQKQAGLQVILGQLHEKLDEQQIIIVV